VGVVVGDGNHEMDSDNDDYGGHRHDANYRPLEPDLAVLQIEAHVGQVTDKVWLAGNLLAEPSPY